MKINWILPFIGKTGGIVVVLEHTRQLRKMGHDVALYYPCLPYRHFLYNQKNPFKKFLGGQVRPFIENFFRRRKSIDWFSEKMEVIPVPWIQNFFIRNADITAATAWPTAYSVAKLDLAKGKKIYFVQHYESWNSDPRLVDGSYRLPLKIITIAPWLTALMREKFSVEPVGEVHNGIDLDFWHPPASKEWNNPGILMMYHELPWKGAEDGLKALEMVHAKFPDIPIRLFGLGPSPDRPEWMEYHRDPSKEALRELYQRSTIFFSPSRTEGWHLPPMEAMACQCALVATRVGCIPVLMREAPILVVEPYEIEKMTEKISLLLADRKKTEWIGVQGFYVIRNFSWNKKTKTLNNLFTKGN